MVRRLTVVVAIAVTCALVQVAERVEAFSRRDRHGRQVSTADRWVWDLEDPAEARLLNYRRRPTGDDVALLSYFSGVLSAVCCNTGHTFDIGDKVCRRVASEPDPLTGRSGITTLPPNCPPPTKYDPESKRCRDVWD